MQQFMRYVEARYHEYERVETYRFFVTEQLRMIPQNKYIQKSILEILEPEEQDNRTAEQIIDDVLEHAGLELI